MLSSFLIYCLLCLFFYSFENETVMKSGQADQGKLCDYQLDEYVGAATCAECHAEAHAKWEESHHYHAMELRGPDTIRADFNNSEFVHYGVSQKFFMAGKKYLVETNNRKEIWKS